MRNTELIRKMSVKCVTAIMIAAMSMSPVAATLAFPMTVYADEKIAEPVDADEKIEDNPADSTVEKIEDDEAMSVNKGTVGINEGNLASNAGTVNENKNWIDTNEKDGKVLVNDKVNDTYALIESNEGSVTINKGVIGVKEGDYIKPGSGNYGTVGTNHYGYIFYNDQTGTINRNGGYVFDNHGTISQNDGRIINNSGTVNINTWKIETNNKNVLTNTSNGIIGSNENGSSVNKNDGEIGSNRWGCLVNTNNGTIATNTGTVETNSATGKITTNRVGDVITNLGTITTNYGTVGSVDAKGNVTGNKGNVETNEKIVLNLDGGVVEKNNGTVYNYGGTVTDKADGTEYFSVKITNSNSTSNSSGLTQAYNQDWLGQTGTTVSTATITITPANGYKITNVSGFGDNVTATQNSDGTWTLTISSGANTNINVSSALINTPSDPSNPSDPFDPSKIKIEVEPDNGNQDNPSGQNQDASNPAVTTPAIDTSATALATATWDGASIKIGETTVTVSALAAQDCAGLTSTAVTQAELTVVYESIFASTIAANGGSVADTRAEALRIATSLAEYITKDLPTNYTPAEAATYKAAYMDAFLKAIASGKTLKKARNAALSAARTKMAQALLDQLNNAYTEGETIGIETSVAPAATQAPVVGEAADLAAAQMIAQAQQAMQDASALANGQ